jgi:CheY-like chemotaxis protein
MSRPLAERQHQTIEVALPDRPVYLEADPIRLAQVFSNLLNNACKYARGPDTITLSATCAGRDVVVSVRDRGIGIPPDNLEGIFEMFSQVNRTLEQSRGGLGIGLTLVRRLVELHGGHVEAHSEGVGHGGEFSVRLPVAGAPASAASDRVTPAPVGLAAGALRILIVDDNVDSAESLALLLQFGGHDTEVAFDGREGLEACERVRPDAILLDIGLPLMSGLEVCQRIRETPEGRSIVIIALTGWGQEDDRERSAAAGFDGHIVKPVDHDALLALLDSLLAARRGRPERATDAGATVSDPGRAPS